MLMILEGLVMCLFLLLFCLIGIANGPVGLVEQAAAMLAGLVTRSC